MKDKQVCRLNSRLGMADNRKGVIQYRLSDAVGLSRSKECV
jgi:hypothetical protein